MPNLSKGTKKAEEVAEENRASGFYRVKTLIMKDGEGPWFLRFVTELQDMTSADTHMFCDTKSKPEQYKGDNWQKTMFAICQNDRMFRVLGPDGKPTDAYEENYGNCYIHNRDRGKVREGKFKKDKSTPDWQTYALAVVREPVPDPVTGRPRGYQDVLDEFKMPDSTIRKIPRFVVVSQKHRNFWSGVEAGLFEGGPLGARDVRISRKENDYNFAVSSPDPVLYPGSPAWARYTEALALTGFDLDTEVLKWASPDWYDRWFVEGATPEGGYGRTDEDSDEKTDGQPAGEQVSDAAVSDFREQLQAARTGGVTEAIVPAALPF